MHLPAQIQLKPVEMVEIEPESAIYLKRKATQVRQSCASAATLNGVRAVLRARGAIANPAAALAAVKLQ